MDLSFSTIQSILSNDIGAKLLRSRTAPVVIPFLFENFKIKVRQQIDNNELEDNLVNYLQKHINAENDLEEDIEESKNDLLKNLDNKKRARKYIDNWCSPEKQYLKRIVTAQGSVLFLDPSIDRLFSWLEKCQETETVGAESRFYNILSQLRKLNQKTNQDTKSRIEELEQQKKKINDEIKMIKETGNVATYDKYQIQERLSEITKSSKELLGDFNQIRSNFQSVINDIYTQQSEKQSSRGDILGYTLDTNDELRNSPQGRSFTSFWNFISSDSENEINNLVDSIMEKSAEQGLQWNDKFLYNLSRYFFDSGNQIVAQNRLLTSRINKMLSFKESGDTTRIRDSIDNIKESLKTYNNLVKEEKLQPSTFDMYVETKPGLFFPQARFPVLPSFDVDFDPIEIYNDEKIDMSAFENLLSQFHVDTKRMVEKADLFYKDVKHQFTLAELTEKYPIEQGLSEIVAWYTIQNSYDGEGKIKTEIDDSKYDEIKFTKNDKTFIVKVPRIMFYE